MKYFSYRETKSLIMIGKNANMSSLPKIVSGSTRIPFMSI